MMVGSVSPVFLAYRGACSLAAMMQEPLLVDALLPVKQQADASQRRTMVNNLLQQVSVHHERLFFQFTPPYSADTSWKVRVMAMLVDAEALEGLWRQMQPGTTLRLKSQVWCIAAHSADMQ